MCIIQVTGLPGAGKTKAITDWLNKNKNFPVTYIDIANYDGPHKNTQFLSVIQQYKKSPTKIIAESACGINYKNSVVIRLQPSIKTIYKQLRLRGDPIDPEYLETLSSIMIPAQYIIRSSDELSQTLTNILI